MKNKFHRWRILASVLLFFFLCMVILAATGPVAKMIPSLPPGLVIGTITSAATFTLTILFLRIQGLGFADAGILPDRSSIVRLGIGFLFGLLLVLLNTLIMQAGGHVRWVAVPQIDISEIIVTLIVYFSLSCREELAFRGYPLFRLESLFGLWTAQFIVALVFAIEHVIGGATWAQALTGNLAGSLLFGMAALTTRGLALPIGLHTAWNFGDWLRGGKGTGGILTAIVEDGFEDGVQFTGIISFVLLAGLATLAFWWYEATYNKKRRSDAEFVDDRLNNQP